MKELSKRCWTEINLSAIIGNYRIYKSNLLENQKVMAVVKADAYGHGDVEVAAALQKEGVQDFAVATVDEAVNLRKSGISGQILILGYTPICEVDSLLAYDITQAIPDEVYAQRLCEVSGAKDVKVHFVLDTGMNRIGLDADNPVYCENVIRKYYDKFNVSGIFTHLCVADCDDENSVEFTKGQIAKFEAVVQKTEDLHIPFVHCLNSAGGLWNGCERSVFARLGIILYGLKPDYKNILPKGIVPGLSWFSVVSVVKSVRAGESIGYGRSFVAKKDMKIATVCAGYADGYNRLLSNNFYVLINGKRAAITGRVCMDQFMVDVSDIPDVEMGSKVVLIGKSGDEVITADDMAARIGTIGYEIVCDISKRVKRIFV